MAVFNKDKEQEELAEDPRTEEAADGAEAQESSTRTDQGTATPVKGKTAKVCRLVLPVLVGCRCLLVAVVFLS